MGRFMVILGAIRQICADKWGFYANLWDMGSFYSNLNNNFYLMFSHLRQDTQCLQCNHGCVELLLPSRTKCFDSTHMYPSTILQA